MTELNAMAPSLSLELSDDDIYNAMKEIPGYLDITPGDFKDLYKRVYQITLQRLSRSILAHHIMSKQVITVHPETSLQDAASLMAKQRISGVPVVDSSNLVVGVLSEKDFITNMGQGTARSFMDIISGCITQTGCGAMAIRKKQVKDIMTTPAITATDKTPLHDISSLLKTGAVNRMPITDKNKILTGIICREDIIFTHSKIIKEALDQQ
jgi:CBS-domain-containing membrane protein